VQVIPDWETNVGSAKQERRFKFRGGVPCLDFVNTLAWRLTDRPVEYLGSYEDLLAWGRQAGLLTPKETEVLSGWAATDSEEARATLSRAVALREAVHRVFSAAIAGEPRDEGALSTLNRELSEALSRLRVAPAAGDAYVLAWDRGGRRWAAAGAALVARGALGGGALDVPETQQGQGLRWGGMRLDVSGREPQRQPQVVRLTRLRQPREGA
jgi:predicted RNA-binding Zn ribbon-like protein